MINSLIIALMCILLVLMSVLFFLFHDLKGIPRIVGLLYKTYDGRKEMEKLLDIEQIGRDAIRSALTPVGRVFNPLEAEAGYPVEASYGSCDWRVVRFVGLSSDGKAVVETIGGKEKVEKVDFGLLRMGPKPE